MKFTSSALIVGSATMASAINDCGDSSFENQSSDGSPSISDCQQIATNIVGDGTFTIPCAEGREHTFARFGRCAIGAHCTIPGANIAHIGNEDAIDLINESIRRFSYDGKVGAKGTMPCSDSFHEQAGVEWGVYHT